jgi:acetyl-CoA acetyltransferase
VAQVPGLDTKLIEDAIIGCAIPEGEQGLNVARMGALLAGLPNTVGGVTVNRFCASGLTALAMAADRIRVGESDVMIAGGCESMSMVPMMGNKPSMSPHIFDRRREHRHRLRHGPDRGEGRRALEDQPRSARTRSRWNRTAARSPRSRPASSTTKSRLHDHRAFPRSRYRRDRR